MQENNKAPKPGKVYVLTNTAMPGLVKIGMTTTSLRARLKSLNAPAAVPRPYEIYYSVEVDDARGAEGLAHKAFADRRDRAAREFFNVPPEQVVAALRLTLINGREIGKTEDVQAREERERRRAKNFRFDAVGIPVGAVLTFWRKPKLKATVVDDKSKVEFKGERMTISKAAKVVLGTNYGVNGTHYWEYKGEGLDDIRTRKEQGTGAKTRTRK